MKVRVKSSNGVANVKILAKHSMESGQRKDGDGKVIPAHYIQDLTVKHKGKVAFVASLGPAVSKNPYIAFNLKGVASGDTLDFDWVDNKGQTASTSETVK